LSAGAPVIQKKESIMYDRKRVRALNDAFRQTLHGGRVLATSSLAEHPNLGAILNLVRNFADFSDDNDPYGEHDFGSLVFGGEQLFWKIDYYDKYSVAQGSLDPSDPALTCRVLTVMRASEY
jgi:hypothetical protein